MDVFADALRQAIALLVHRDPYVLQALWLSLRVSSLAVIIAMLTGLPVGVGVGIGRFRGRQILVALIHTGFALPPVVVGLFVYMLLSRQGPFPGLRILFTPGAMVVAQSLLAAPYVAGVSLAAVQAVPADVRLQARALGASRLRALWMHVREARVGIVAAIIAGFGAVISEVGAAMMVGGNISGQTRVLTTAIVLETRRGNFALAAAMGLILLFMVLVINLLLARVQSEDGWRRRASERPWS
ncbi:MAG TPA: ABC transporter permease [Longimicrobiales bacterium]|nr:ABC transporter permease [Longimicrobiales bacterium]